MLKAGALVAVVALALGGCGGYVKAPTEAPLAVRPSGRTEAPLTVGELAHRCRLPVTSMAAELEATLKEAKARGLHGSLPEIAVNLDKLSRYAESRREHPDCKALLRALVISAREPAQG